MLLLRGVWAIVAVLEVSLFKTAIRAMGVSSLARLTTMPISAALVFASTFVLINYSGAVVFGWISLIGSLFQLLPFADLGVGAAVVNEVAASRQANNRGDGSLKVVRAAFRLLSLSCVFLLTLVGIISIAGLWPGILGIPSEEAGDANLAVFLSLCVFALSLPVAVGSRVLIGAGLNHINAWLGSVGAVLGFVVTVSLVGMRVDPILLAIASPASVALGSLAQFVVALKVMGWTFGGVVRGARARWILVLAPALPMLVINMTVPLAMQSGRLILSHFGSGSALAEYAASFQFYVPALSVITFATMSLWPVFAGSRDDRIVQHQVWIRLLGILGATGAMAGVLFAGLVGWAVTLASGGEIDVQFATAIAFGSLIFVMAIHQPSAMLLTDRGGLIFQAVCSTAMLALCLLFSIWGALTIGAAGVVWGACIAILLGQVFPEMVLLMRRGKSSRRCGC